MDMFNLRGVLQSVRRQLLEKWQESSFVPHPGGKGGIRETEIRRMLRKRLPEKYSCGTGQVSNAAGEMSRQCDVIIFDAHNGVRLLPSKEHRSEP